MSLPQLAIKLLQEQHNFTFPWTCNKCTYLNSERIDECSVCHYSNPQYDSNIAAGALQRARSQLQQIQRDNYGQKFRKTFNVWPVLLPVIHVINRDQALRNTKKVFNAGCDGVWLIHHRKRGDCKKSEEILAECYAEVRNFFPEKWIGVNVLSFINQPLKLFSWVKENCPNCNGIWVDNAFATSPEVMKRISMLRTEVEWDGLYFGGVAFKYQEKLHPLQDAVDPPIEAIKLLQQVTQQAKAYIDVITTSGIATGNTPSLKKIEAMHSVACPLAISGCGIDFASSQHFCDAFLVATSLSVDCPTHLIPDECEESFTELDEVKLQNWFRSIEPYRSNDHQTVSPNVIL